MYVLHGRHLVSCNQLFLFLQVEKREELDARENGRNQASEVRDALIIYQELFKDLTNQSHNILAIRMM